MYEYWWCTGSVLLAGGTCASVLAKVYHGCQRLDVAVCVCVSCGAVAWAILPTLGWRYLTAFAAVPVFITLVLIGFVPRSPMYTQPRPSSAFCLAVTHTTCRRYLCAVGKYAEAAEVIREAAKANGKVRTVAIAPLLLPCELAYALLVVAGHAAVYIETHPGPRGCQCQQAVRPGAPQEHVAHLARVVRFRGRLLWGTVAGALCGATLVLAC